MTFRPQDFKNSWGLKNFILNLINYMKAIKKIHWF